MPKLLLFAACERVIIDQDSNVASLVALLQDITIGIPADAQMPERAMLPMKWHAFTLWFEQPEDSGKQYVQEIELCDPDGNILLTGSSEPFKMSLLTHRLNATFNTFPLTQFGQYLLKAYLREDKEGKERTEVASYPRTIKKPSV
jgi:hypothetical protein